MDFYQQQAISPVASRENQAYSTSTGVTGYAARNDSPKLYQKWFGFVEQ